MRGTEMARIRGTGRNSQGLTAGSETGSGDIRAWMPPGSAFLPGVAPGHRGTSVANSAGQAGRAGTNPEDLAGAHARPALHSSPNSFPVDRGALRTLLLKQFWLKPVTDCSYWYSTVMCGVVGRAWQVRMVPRATSASERAMRARMWTLPLCNRARQAPHTPDSQE